MFEENRFLGRIGILKYLGSVASGLLFDLPGKCLKFGNKRAAFR